MALCSLPTSLCNEEDVLWKRKICETSLRQRAEVRRGGSPVLGTQISYASNIIKQRPLWLKAVLPGLMRDDFHLQDPCWWAVWAFQPNSTGICNDMHQTIVLASFCFPVPGILSQVRHKGFVLTTERKFLCRNNPGEGYSCSTWIQIFTWIY